MAETARKRCRKQQNRKARRRYRAATHISILAPCLPGCNCLLHPHALRLGVRPIFVWVRAGAVRLLLPFRSVRAPKKKAHLNPPGPSKEMKKCLAQCFPSIIPVQREAAGLNGARPIQRFET